MGAIPCGGTSPLAREMTGDQVTIDVTEVIEHHGDAIVRGRYDGTFDKTKPQPNQSIGYTKDEGKWVANFETLPLMGSSAGGGDSTAPDLLRVAVSGRKDVRPHPHRRRHEFAPYMLVQTIRSAFRKEGRCT